MLQQQPQANQTVYPEPPAVVSTKDHLYLQDMLSWNLNAMKKAHFFANQCQDAEIKQAIEQSCFMHERHYQLLLKHLGQNQMPGAMQGGVQ
ncbi:MAG TPA: hypothetical protein VLA13_04350 [Massilibacterium sp.]|nr:hypothetical protein [Massilibacterium sp.]